MTLAFVLTMLEGAAPHEGSFPEWIPQTFNLLIFLGILAYVLRKPMAKFFETRSAAILAELDKAKHEKEDAQAKLAEVEARLSKLAGEQEAIRAEAAAEADAEHVRLTARAEEDARKIGEIAVREIDGALKAARAELQRFAAEKAVDLAEATIRGEMNDADRERMVGQYAEQIGGAK